MPTRRSLILKWADEESLRALDLVPENQIIKKSTLRKVYTVCRALVDRKKPRYPSAKEVAESGSATSFGYDDFPAVQTLNNHYSKMMGFWRKAYRDIEAIEAEPSESAEQLIHWDASHLDAGDVANINSLKRMLTETVKKNNALKRLITDHVAVNLDHFRPDDSGVFDDLAHWMSTITLDGFEQSGFGIVVTPRSPPGTIIMDQVLWESLERLVNTYRLIEKRRGVDGDESDLGPP
jgi:hypothetical protein